MNYKTALDQLNQELTKHSEASGYGSNASIGLNPRSPSAQLLNQKHADKAKATSRTAFNQAHEDRNFKA